jgi:hypothetical protein
MFSFKAFTPRLVVLHSMRRRGRVCRKAASTILQAAQQLQQSEDPVVNTLAQRIMDAAQGLEA